MYPTISSFLLCIYNLFLFKIRQSHRLPSFLFNKEHMKQDEEERTTAFILILSQLLVVFLNFLFFYCLYFLNLSSSSSISISISIYLSSSSLCDCLATGAVTYFYYNIINTHLLTKCSSLINLYY